MFYCIIAVVVGEVARGAKDKGPAGCNNADCGINLLYYMALYYQLLLAGAEV